MVTKCQLEVRAGEALFKLMKSFSLLETNLGLAIAHLENPGHSESSYPKLFKLSVNEMFDRLDALLKGEPGRASDQRSADYEAWKASARTARRIRNNFVHGWLDLLPSDREAPVHLQQPPWWPADPALPRRMSIADLEKHVSEVELVWKGFAEFRRKYRI